VILRLFDVQSQPLELPLAERVAACWLHLQYAETVSAQNLRSLTLPQADY